MNEVVVAEGKQENSLSTPKRGLDLAKVDYVMGREQERDLSLIYRFDQIQAFCEAPVEERRRFHYQRKPSDPVLIQAFWEAHLNYKRALAADDEKLMLQWFDRCLDIADKCEDKRTAAMDRLMSWKKHAEEMGKTLDAATTEELEKLANA